MRPTTFYSGSARIICLGILLSAAILATSCIGTIRNIAKPAKLRQYQEFFDKPLYKQHVAFQTYPVEKQFDIYIVAMTMRQPPDTGFAIDIAKKGGVAVPFLIKKLSQENYPGYRNNASTRENIKEKTIFIFRMMSRYNYYDVKRDKQTIEMIRNEIENMQIAHYRQLSMEYLRVILGED
jgi:hypothetical protein